MDSHILTGDSALAVLRLPVRGWHALPCHFRKRFNREGGEADAPQTFVNVPDGVILDSEFVERIEPPSLHVEDDMEEGDDFLSLGSEIWEYDIADGRDREFRDAVLNSQMALDIERIEDIEDIPALSGQ